QDHAHLPFSASYAPSDGTPGVRKAHAVDRDLCRLHREVATSGPARTWTVRILIGARRRAPRCALLTKRRRIGKGALPRSRSVRRNYRAAIKATVVSSIRLEKPHSLSYQLETLTRLPMTFVSVASKTDDNAL